MPGHRWVQTLVLRSGGDALVGVGQIACHPHTPKSDAGSFTFPEVFEGNSDRRLLSASV